MITIINHIKNETTMMQQQEQKINKRQMTKTEKETKITNIYMNNNNHQAEQE